MNELKVIEQNNNAIINVEEYKQIATQWLTSTGNLQKFTENEKAQFIDMCCAFGLNPIKREIYGIKYKGKNGFPDTFNIVLGYEVYLKRAERTGQLDGYNVEVKKLGEDMVATCTVYRKDWTHPFIHSVLLSEYHQHNKMWNEKPVTMIKKVAIEQSFRMCFPDEMGGLPYGMEELPSEDLSSAPSPNVKDVTPSNSVSVESPKNNNKIAPKYTKEQALQLAEVMNAKINETSVFSDEEKESYRKMLKDGLFEDAFKSASDLLETRKAASDDIPEGIF